MNRRAKQMMNYFDWANLKKHVRDTEAIPGKITVSQYLSLRPDKRPVVMVDGMVVEYDEDEGGQYVFACKKPNKSLALHRLSEEGELAICGACGEGFSYADWAQMPPEQQERVARPSFVLVNNMYNIPTHLTPMTVYNGRVVESVSMVSAETYFDMGTWWQGVVGCGSAGCLGGHMAVMFPECGLELVYTGKTSRGFPGFVIHTKRGEFRGYDALGRLFSGVLTKDEIDHLFSPSAYIDERKLNDEDKIPLDEDTFRNYPTPKEVGQRVLDLLLQKGLIDESMGLVMEARNDR